MKLKVQAQHLQPGDIVGSGEAVKAITISSTKWPSSKVQIVLGNDRVAYWGKYTDININRPWQDDACPS